MTSNPASFKNPCVQPAAQEEWTQVRRKGRRRNPGRTQSWPQPRDSSSDIPKRGPRISNLTVDEVRTAHDRIASQWAASPLGEQLAAALALSPPLSVSTAVCLGIGTFDPDDGSWELRRRAHVQLAAFLFMVDHYRKRQGGDSDVAIRCVFQEPLFTPTDRAFLEGLGHVVVDTPEAFAVVGPGTLLFAVHMYRDVYTRAIAGCVPAVFVGTAYEVWEDIHSPQEEEWTCMKELNERCDKVPFPDDDQLTFSNTYIHWRRDGDS
ncbi:hypothetical protein F4810DRAFT_691976 [Camillea tinctor]|nr:hypothetical protein F4810DRAFT_691976 [Camillea tinctor]